MHVHSHNIYHLQHSYGKVMFSQASVILFTGGVFAPLHAGIPPWADTPLSDRRLLLWTVCILLECILVVSRMI